MENSIDQTKYLSGSSLPFQEVEERFDDWVSWLHTIVPVSEWSLTPPLVDATIDPAKYAADEENDDGRNLDDEWRWVDDGGESGEVL